MVSQMKMTTFAMQDSPFPPLIAILFNPQIKTMNILFKAYRSIDVYLTTPKYTTQMLAM